ncbi:hypothetical protein LRY65_03775 [Candidatus Woesebacteria bacterium]|nr:hypothetical protein [Candidatus Woesebacteria bacterium]MCD8507010.1 hypothetical protein [Candidatus Woesebacteria bacterium]MCD8527301.1 hypothetical protein [Candidatus Woesebacteria bacterium]MCD8546666.1 hypothetical protein [Candidatus Woesebacteria bacterium]
MKDQRNKESTYFLPKKSVPAILKQVGEIDSCDAANSRLILHDILTNVGLMLGGLALSSVPVHVISLLYTAYVVRRMAKAEQMKRDHSLFTTRLFQELNDLNDHSADNQKFR